MSPDRCITMATPPARRLPTLPATGEPVVRTLPDDENLPLESRLMDAHPTR